MLSAIAARRARLHKSPPSLKPSSKRRHTPAGPNSSTKKARKDTSKLHSEQKNVITTTVSREEGNISVDYSDDMSITLDQQDTTLIPHERPLEPVLRGHTKAYSPSRPVADFSDDESDASEQPLTDLSQLFSYNRLLTNEEPQILSTYRPADGRNIFSLSLDEGSALGLSGPAIALVLSPLATVSFVGAYRLRVLRGSVSLLGTRIQPSRVLHRVFAPQSSPIPAIKALVTHGGSSKSLYDIPAQITGTIDEGDAIIVLQELRTGIEGLGRVMRTFEGVFRQTHSEGVFDMPLGGVHLLWHSFFEGAPFAHTESQVSQLVRGMRAFQIPPSWEAAFSASSSFPADETTGLLTPHVLLVKGQKNSGKSTFARMVTNRLSSRYRRVAFLECDLGQSEFTPGGMVALSIIERPVFGPPFTHPTLPHQAHYIGAHNPRSSPSRYLCAIQALVDVYRLDLQFATSLVDIEDGEEDDRIADVIPLVINTMGWTKGLGTDLARRIEELVQPSYIFSFEPPRQWAAVHTLEPITPPQRFTPSDHRALSLLSYFHAVFLDTMHPTPLGQTAASRWNTDLPLCAQPPYEITSNLALDRIVLVGAGAEDVVRTELGRVLSGALVALVSVQPPPEEIEELYTPGSLPPDPASSNCIGLALVRGVSNDGSKLQLLTPVPPERLVDVRILVMGELQLPVWGWLDFRTAEGRANPGVDVPFLRWGRSAGAGSERRRVRRNIMRRAQI
ncbi:hypothetical protein BJV77DRAFT_1179556 [Russula vinacea]|nr:hypothetical protein BJV77DRAFT_1179556 [Russula vinacea]